MRRSITTLVGLLVALLVSGTAPVGAWTAGDLLRGPTAMLNAPLVPVRSAVGGVVAARDDKQTGGQRRIMLPPFLAIAGGTMGVAEGIIWLATGLADTVTGGAFALAPEEATRLSVAPLAPLFLTNARQPHPAPR